MVLLDGAGEDINFQGDKNTHNILILDAQSKITAYLPEPSLLLGSKRVRDDTNGVGLAFCHEPFCNRLFGSKR